MTLRCQKMEVWSETFPGKQKQKKTIVNDFNSKLKGNQRFYKTKKIEDEG